LFALSAVIAAFLRTHQHGSEKAPLVSAAAAGDDAKSSSSSSSYGLSGSTTAHSSSSSQFSPSGVELTTAAPVPPPAARNLNLDAAYLHVLGDLVQSIGVAIAGLLIW
jgi:Co/Zn/Cd efflux system component